MSALVISCPAINGARCRRVVVANTALRNLFEKNKVASRFIYFTLPSFGHDLLMSTIAYQFKTNKLESASLPNKTVVILISDAFKIYINKVHYYSC